MEAESSKVPKQVLLRLKRLSWQSISIYCVIVPFDRVGCAVGAVYALYKGTAVHRHHNRIIYMSRDL